MKIKLLSPVLVLTALGVTFSAQAHDPKEHMKDAENPNCATMKDMDHSKMDHGAMQSESGSMDHSQMGHSQSQEKAPAMDHSKMGHGTMQGQMEGMDHSKMNHGSAEAPPPGPRHAPGSCVPPSIAPPLVADAH